MNSTVRELAFTAIKFFDKYRHFVVFLFASTYAMVLSSLLTHFASSLGNLFFSALGAGLLLGLLLARLLLVVGWRPAPTHSPHHAKHLLVVLGSGGHTTEMLTFLLSSLDPALWPHRTYLVTSGDNFSRGRAQQFENQLFARACKAFDTLPTNMKKASPADLLYPRGLAGYYQIIEVPRARKIHQSIFTVPFSALKSLYAIFTLFLHMSLNSSMHISPTQGRPRFALPDIILCNGPATSVFVIYAALLMRFLGFGEPEGGKLRCWFVESFTRINSLSLSGNCVALVVERLLVQWPQLQGVWGRGEFPGTLCH